MQTARRRRTRIKHSSNSSSRRPALSAAFQDSTVTETAFLVGIVVLVALVLWIYQSFILSFEITDQGRGEQSEISLNQIIVEPPNPVKESGLLRNLSNNNNHNNNSPQTSTIVGGYNHFSIIAQELAALDPTDTLERLEREDPFGTRKFDSLLLQQETELGRVLTIQEVQQLFPCPNNKEERITLPDARVEQKARDFRDGKKGTFLFFQHLRKAGGTDFCSLAEENLPKSAKPPYYCMPDMKWSGHKNAGYLHSWSNPEIITRMEVSGYRIAGNEWENFDVSRHFDLPAVFATSFRKPLDRALSQFRFECIEDRGCHVKDVHIWWERRKDLRNIYTTTFADPREEVGKYFKGEYSNERRNLMATAIDTLSKFNIVLAMEWLAYGAPQVRSILGFDKVSSLTTRVRPHISQAKRDDGQDKNSLGSASIAKASWVPKDYLDAKQYKKMSEDLALDEILTDVARRMFLERLVCED